MAVLDSVTVSMAALTNGIFNRMVRVNAVLTSTSLGKTSEKAGTSSTSSNVKRSSISFRLFPITFPHSCRPTLFHISNESLFVNLPLSICPSSIHSDTSFLTFDDRFARVGNERSSIAKIFLIFFNIVHAQTFLHV
jgi:hypothetical protein